MLEPNAGTPNQFSAHSYRWALLAGVWLVYFCFGLTTVSMAPLVGVIGSDLELSRSRMGTVLGAWQFVFIASAIPCGMILERVGPRRAILFALATFAVSVALRASATGHASLFVTVAAFGFGAPIVSIGAPKLISQWFEGSDRRLAMGIYISGPFLGNIMGLSFTNSVLMPALDGNWRAVLLVYAGFVTVAGLVWLGVTAHPVYRATEGRSAAEAGMSQVQDFTRLVRVPAVRVVLAMVFGIFFFNHALTNWLPEILRSRAMDAASAGYWASIPTAAAIVSALSIPRLAKPEWRVPILFVLFMLAAAATMALHFGPGLPLASGLVCQGLARGAMMTVMILTLFDIPEVGPRRTGMAGSLFFLVAELGGVLGPVSVGVVSDVGGFDASLTLLSGVCLVLTALLVVLRRIMP